MKRLATFATLSLMAAMAAPALGQSRSDRVNEIAAALASGVNERSTPSDTVYTDARTGAVVRATPAQLMRQTLTAVDFDAMPGRLALEVWANQTQVPLVIDWAALENQGIDPETPITLKLKGVPANLVLKLLVQQLHPDPIGDDELLLDVQEWYVRVITKEQALRRSETRLYFIGDLLMDIPNFDNAPGFDLNDALSNTSTGGSRNGGGGGGERGLFDDLDGEDREEDRVSKEERAERIADLIRNTIEPEIWQANGGEYASVRYLRGMLIVKAPAFVHEQIGGATGASTSSRDRAATRSRQSTRSSEDRQQARPRPQRSSSSGVSGVAPTRSRIRP